MSDEERLYRPPAAMLIWVGVGAFLGLFWREILGVLWRLFT